MERRDFLKLTVAMAATAAGAAALAASAEAAPLSPVPLGAAAKLPATPELHPAVTTAEEVDRLKPEQVRWGRHWHRRHWGWHRRHWRRWHRRHYW
jgi:hypothetical protein